MIQVKPGDKIIYAEPGSVPLKGIIKADFKNEDKAWAVFYCMDDWENYENYEGQLIHLQYVSLGCEIQYKKHIIKCDYTRYPAHTHLPIYKKFVDEAFNCIIDNDILNDVKSINIWTRGSSGAILGSMLFFKLDKIVPQLICVL